MMQLRLDNRQAGRTCEPHRWSTLADAPATVTRVTAFRIGEAAELLGVSVDTVRRWVDAGRLAAARDEHGHRVIAGADLAGFVRSQASEPDSRSEQSSARNRLRGIVTAIVRDTVMAQVDIQAGPFRVVSLMSREAVDALDLEVGSVAVAVIKSTTVVVERSTFAADTRRNR
jgi:molybdopterin-binding protein